MPRRGALIAINEATARMVLAATDDADEMHDLVGTIDDSRDDLLHVEIDRAWDAIHRALSDGTLDPAAGSAPLNRTILGGQLHDGEDYLMAFVTTHEVT